MNKFFATVELWFIYIRHWFAIRQDEPDVEGIHFAGLGDIYDYVSRRHYGLAILGTEYQLEETVSQRHMLVVGSSGSRKTRSVCIPTALLAGGSLIISSPSPEMLEVCAPHLNEKGYNIIVIDYRRINRSHTYNPFHYVTSISDCNRLASILIHSSLSDRGQQEFWSKASIRFLSIFVALVHKMPEEFRHMAQVVKLITRYSVDPEYVDKMIVRFGDADLLERYQYLIKSEARLVKNIIETVLVAVELFNDSDIQRLTATDTLNMDKWRHEHHAVFIISDMNHQKFYAPLTNMLVSQIIQYQMASIPNPETDLAMYMILDEFGSMFLGSDYPNILAQLRKHLVSTVHVVQSENQLLKYGTESETIKQNCHTVMYLGGVRHDIKICKEIETIAGTIEIKEEETERVRTLPVISSTAVRELPPGFAVVFIGNSKPMVVSVTPLWENILLSYRLKNAPPLEFLDHNLPAPSIYDVNNPNG